MARRIEEGKQAALERERLEREAAAAAAAEAAAAEAAAAHAASLRRESRRESALASLEAFDAGANGAVGVVIKLPDGGRCTGRFRPTDPLEALFAMVEAQWREGEGQALLPETFHLAASYPRRLFARPSVGVVPAPTLSDSGLVSSQEALFVEV